MGDRCCDENNVVACLNPSLNLVIVGLCLKVLEIENGSKFHVRILTKSGFKMISKLYPV